MQRTLLGLALALVAASVGAATFTVTNTNDSGAGSLRQAILSANGTPGLDTIQFAIPGSGVQTITLSTPLGCRTASADAPAPPPPPVKLIEGADV